MRSWFVFAGVPMFYNTLVALPMSLSLMKDRLQQGYYRQLEGWLGDVATLESNARAFCGDDSPVTEAAAGVHPHPCPAVWIRTATKLLMLPAL